VRSSGRLLLALLPALLLCAPGAAGAPADRGEDGSLEQLLREVRRRREAAAAKLAVPVTDLVQQLQKASTGDGEAAEKAKVQLVALGTEAAPLLVPHLDPGQGALGPDRRRASLVAEVLEQLPTRSVTDALITMARTGSPHGRLNALRVLGTSPDRAAAGACLIEAVRTSDKDTRVQALRSLARLGGAEHETVLVEALAETDPDVLRAVLTALTGVRSVAGRERVRTLMGAPQLAVPLVKEITAYLRAIAPSLAPEDFEALARLAAHESVAEKDGLLILDTIADLQPQLDAKLHKLFEPLLANQFLRTDAQLCLARLGDRNERRDLIKRFDELVARNEDWAGGYEQRGGVLLKLGEYGEAARDYARAVKLYQTQGREIEDSIYIELARAYVLDQNLKKAHEALTEGGLASGALKQLKTDPDFQTLAESGKYGRIFD